jgi:hypothetical protein
VNHDACHRIVPGDDLAAEVAEADGLLTHLVCLPVSGVAVVVRGARASPCTSDDRLSNICSIPVCRFRPRAWPAGTMRQTLAVSALKRTFAAFGG